MLLEILKRTPPWVFALFFLLLALGYGQSRTRVVARRNVALLPAAMLLLSCYGVISVFGAAPLAIASWLAGAAIAVWLGIDFGFPRGVSCQNEGNSFSIPGSWLPLVLMMVIFFTRYTVAVLLARQPSLAEAPEFAGLTSYSYGFTGGLFLSRVLVIWRPARPRG
jgi:hypothetical protein